MTNSDKAKIEEFLLDISCLEDLEKWSNKLNIFRILHITDYELKHSAMLAWLLNAKESHGLGKSFLVQFISKAIRNSKKKAEVKIEDWMLADIENAQVIREWYASGDKNRLDILVVIPNKTAPKKGMILAIENKIRSKEGVAQTKKYRDVIRQRFPNYEHLFVFLTPYKDYKPSSSDWIVIPYSDVYKVLDALVTRKEINETVREFMRQYMEIIKGELMEDNELINLCTRIYNEHKEALDLIYRYKEDDVSIIARAVKEELKKLSADSSSDIEYDESYDSGVTYVRFYTKYIDKILPDSKVKNIHGNFKRYFIEIHLWPFKKNKKCTISFVLMMDNYENQLKTENTPKVIEIFKGKAKGEKTCSLKSEKDLFGECNCFDIDFVAESVDKEEFSRWLQERLKTYVTEIEQKLNSSFDNDGAIRKNETGVGKL